MAFDIEGARKAGYSDDEIADHLGAQRGLDVRAARQAGYTSSEILAELSDTWAKQPLPAGVKPSAAGAGRGGQGGPTAEQAGLASARKGGTRAEARPYVAPGEPDEVLTRPPAEPVQGQQPLIQQRGAPVNDEVLQATLQQLSTMTREQRLAQEKRTDIPAWMRSTVAAANRRLEAADLGAERTGMTGPTIEARTARNMRDGADLPTARAAAVASASAGVPTRGLQQATTGPGLLTGDEVNANRAEGEKVQRQSIGARGMYAAQEGLIGGTAGVIAAGLRAIGDDETAKFYEKAGQGAAVRAQAAGELQRMQSAAREAGILPAGPLSGLADYADEMATGAANSVGQMIPGLVAGIATGNAAVGLGLMALPVFGQSYIAKRDDGGSPAAAAGYGGAMAALEIIGERYGLMPAALNAFRKQAATKTLEELPGFLERGIVAMEKRGLFAKPVGAVLRVQAGEQVGEQITSAGQYLLDGTEFGLNQPISLGGFLANARDTAVQTLLATGAVQAAGAGAKRLLEQAGDGDPSRQVGRALAEDVQGTEFRRDAIDGYAARASDPRFYDPTFVDPRNTTKAAAAATPAAPRARPAPRPAAPAAPMPDGRIEPTMQAAAPAPAPAADGQDFTGLDEAPAAPVIATPVDEAAHAAATSPTNDRPEPTQAQKDAGNYAKGHVRIAGMDFAIENPQGSVRRGVDPDGNAWETPLVAHYGYAKGTRASDGDHSDVFIKPGTQDDYTGPVFVIDQVKPDGTFDEHKTVIGADTEAEARALYLGNYTPGWNGLGAITQLPIDAYKSWVRDGVKRRPLGNITPRQGAAADDNQRDMAVPAPVAAGAAADGGAVAGGSGGTVGSQPVVDGGVQPPAEAPALGSGAAVPAGDAGQPDQALTPPATGDVWRDKQSGITFRLGFIHAPSGTAEAEILTGRTRNGKGAGSTITVYPDRLTGNGYERVQAPVAGPTFAAGQRVTIDGAAWTVDKVGTASVTLTDAAGGKRVVATNSKTFQRIKQEPNEAAQPQPQTPAGESAAPAAAPAATAPVVPGARAGAVEAAGLTDQPPKRTEARGTAKHPKTVAGSSVLAMVSQSLGGLDPTWLSEFSSRQEINRIGKDGRRMVQWHNPLIPGVGRMFRKGGTQDLQALAELMEEAGYLEPGSVEADTYEAGQRAKDMVRSALQGDEPLTWQGRIAKAQQEAADEDLAAPDWLGEFDDAELDAAGYTAASPEVQQATAALLAEAEALGLDTEALVERAAMQSSGQPEDAYHEALQGLAREALAAARQQAAGPDAAAAGRGGEDRSPADGEPGQEPAAQEGLTLSRGASAIVAREEADFPVTKRQQSSPYARLATGRYIVTVQQFERGPGVVAYAVYRSERAGTVATWTEELPSSMLEAGEFSALAAAGRRLFDRVSAAQATDLLTTQTTEDLRAKAEREAAAEDAERRKKAAEQERLRKEAEQRDNRARADQTVDDFQLGQSAEQQMSGMGDLFADPPAAPATPAASSSAAASRAAAGPTIELRKRLSVLRSLRECIG